MRILFYSPDTYGLGHVRRTVLLCERLLAALPDASALILTGAPRAHYFRYPARCDYVKLPAVTKDDDGKYVSNGTDLSIEDTVRFRSKLVLESGRSFRPDVVLVDHNPTGLHGEILPLLEEMPRIRPGVVRLLGMRDVIDEPEVVRNAWTRGGTVETLRRYYDRVFVYGQRDLFDSIRAYDVPGDVARRFQFVGYIGGWQATTGTRELRERYAPRTGRLVAATVGGGGDGRDLLRDLLEGYRRAGRTAGFEVVLVTGPLMSPGKRRRLSEIAGRTEGVSILEYCDDLPGLYRAADFTVSMGGYNTVCELAAQSAKSLIVPRVFPRKEQLVRARRLEERGAARFLHPDDATPAALIEAIREGLASTAPTPRRWGLDLDGLSQTAAGVLEQVTAAGLAAAAGATS